ncbi:hypothetical protein V8E36_003953 [Tilletia maclaganii]
MRTFLSQLVTLAIVATLSLTSAADSLDKGANHIVGVQIRRHHHLQHQQLQRSTELAQVVEREEWAGIRRPDAFDSDDDDDDANDHTTTTHRKHRPTTTSRKHKSTRKHTMTRRHTTTRKHSTTHKPTSTRKHTTTTTQKPVKTTTKTTSPPQATHKYGLMYSDKIRGVSEYCSFCPCVNVLTPFANLCSGNYLVVENWMDVRLDQALNQVATRAPAWLVTKTKGKPIIDEYTMGLYADKAKAAELVKAHFDSWMTEKDWRRIAKYGLNSVRIPFPHFAFEDCIEQDAPYLPLNRLEKLKESVLMAKKYGLKVWISLHTLPGSQNGYDSSGKIGSPKWATQAEYATLSKRAFQHLVDIFSQEPYASAILAIEPANEPTAAQDPDILATLQKFYPAAFEMYNSTMKNARTAATKAGVSAPKTKFAFHDGWKGMGFWVRNPFLDEDQRKHALLGMHPYYIFGDEVHGMTDSQRIAKACAYGDKIANFSSSYTIVVSECGINAPQGDNGWGRDMHQADFMQFDDPKLEYKMSKEYMRFLALNFRAQQQAYERGAGWMIWSWKHYQHRDWSYKSGVRYGWLPRTPEELDQQPFGKLCP